MLRPHKLFAALSIAMLALPATAQVRIGLMVSSTGPTTAIGIPQKNTGDLLPRKIGNATVEYFQLDDGGDTTRAVQNAKKLIQENNIDALIGPSTTPNALAILDLIAEAKVPMMATVGTSSVVEPLDAKRRWVYKTTQNDDLIAAALIKHMQKAGVKNVGFIGFNDPYGENWLKVFGGLADKAGLKLAAIERYNRTDQSVTGQALKVISAKPDAVLVAGVGGPGVLPQVDAARPGLQGNDLPDARCRDRRLHPPRQGQGRGHGACRGSDARHRRDRGLESDQARGAELHHRLREAVRPEAGDVRREHLGRRAASSSARFQPRSRKRSPAPRRSARRCATRSSRSARSSAARACST